jgi:ABC-type Fe3+ transport system permease subunit
VLLLLLLLLLLPASHLFAAPVHHSNLEKDSNDSPVGYIIHSIVLRTVMVQPTRLTVSATITSAIGATVAAAAAASTLYRSKHPFP